MEGTELQMAREYLGLSGAELARMLGVRADTVKAWELGKSPVPFRTPGEVAAIAEMTHDAVDELANRLQEGAAHTVPIYRRDADFHAAHPDHAHLPARWWRHVVARAVEDLPNITIVSA